MHSMKKCMANRSKRHGRRLLRWSYASFEQFLKAKAGQLFWLFKNEIGKTSVTLHDKCVTSLHDICYLHDICTACICMASARAEKP